MMESAYLQSTQHKQFTFTRAKLHRLRETLNASRALSVSSGPSPTDPPLTLQETSKLIRFYKERLIELSDFCKLPTAVKATAIAYLTRFYLAQSPMDQHPRVIMPACVFLATKTENFYTPLSTFASKLPKSSPESITAAELILIQGLKFCLTVHHPFRALEGSILELFALAEGTGGLRPSTDSTAASRASDAAKLKQEMRRLPRKYTWSPRSRHDSILANPLTRPADDPTDTSDIVRQRIDTSFEQTRTILRTAALLTDVTLLFPPSQIWPAAMLLVDIPLVLWYLRTKLGPQNDALPRLLTQLEACAHMMWEYLQDAPAAKPDALFDELRDIDRKLWQYRHQRQQVDDASEDASTATGTGPDKASDAAVGAKPKSHEVHPAAGEPGKATDEDRRRKKRRLEREHARREGDDVFGDAL